MRIALSAVVFAALIVNGGKPQTKTNADAEHSNQPPQQTVSVVNQEAPEGKGNDQADKPKSYFSRLFSPENIPNISLAVIGILTLVAIWYQGKIDGPRHKRNAVRYWSGQEKYRLAV
jgi:hypothetical protein